MNPKEYLARFLSTAGNKLRQLSRRLSPPAPGEPPNRFLSFMYPGHFYSPIPVPKFVDENAASLFRTDVASLPGIDDNWAGQIQLTRQFLNYSNDYKPALTRAEAQAAGARFFSDNAFFWNLMLLSITVSCGTFARAELWRSVPASLPPWRSTCARNSSSHFRNLCSSNPFPTGCTFLSGKVIGPTFAFTKNRCNKWTKPCFKRSAAVL
jgi:hypothetical protein